MKASFAFKLTYTIDFLMREYDLDHEEAVSLVVGEMTNVESGNHEPTKTV